MYYKLLPPHPDLRLYIGCYWILQTGYSDFLKQEVIIPDGYAELILNLGASYQWQTASTSTVTSITSTHIVGQRNTSVTVKLPPLLNQVGVKIKPLGLRNLFNLPSLQVYNQLIHTSDVSAAVFTELAEKVYEASSEITQKQILDNFFLQKLTKLAPVDVVTEAALRNIVAKKGLLRMDELKNTLGIDYRTLERRFKSTVGLTPKEFARVIRFKNVYKAFRTSQVNDAAYFLDWGYYDQSHYIKEFKYFMGNTPKAYQSGGAILADTILKSGLTKSQLPTALVA